MAMQYGHFLFPGSDSFHFIIHKFYVLGDWVYHCLDVTIFEIDNLIPTDYFYEHGRRN